ncbi:MAG: SAM-dependent methyltransferase [Bacteroidales bacterium]|nr:SAM-dependent methyltransferase [Bacteroidales bacterium]
MRQIEPIAHIHTDFPGKFGVPRQSGLVAGLQGRIVFCPPFRDPDALRGLEDFSHLWLIWGFSANRPNGPAHARNNAAGTASDEVPAYTWQPTVRPPRMGGNKAFGVFATRSPFRPNGLGLSSVEIGHIELKTPQGPIIHVLGADLTDGTPIYDIKPYLAYTDAHPQARGGFTDTTARRLLPVSDPDNRLEILPADKRLQALELIAQDPRPSYQRDAGRVYGLPFAGHDIKFQVNVDRATITDVMPLSGYHSKV